nr:uncharacterized mitochondrial protein AtMg00810-like [Tanacetum cinerariifolium]
MCIAQCFKRGLAGMRHSKSRVLVVGVSLGSRFLLVSLVLIAYVSRAVARPSVISHWMVAKVMAGVSDVDSSGDIVDLIGDEDPTDEDGDTEVSVSLGEISSEGKKYWESDIGDCDNTRDGVNTACYVQNKVLVIKPYNKTPYELLPGQAPSIGFMRPFGCHVTILNTLDSLDKFDGKVDEGFLVGYSINSKALRVFNSRTRIIQETLHVNFLENKPNVAGSGPKWLFDIDTLTRTVNYQPVTTSNQTNPSNTDGDVAFDEKEPEFEAKKHESKVNVLPRSSAQLRKHDDKTKKGAKDKIPTVRKNSPNSTNTFSVAGPSNAVASPTYRKSSCIDASQYPDDLDMPELEDITYSDDEDDVGAEANFNNLETSIPQKKDGIFISQGKYVAEILRKFGLSDGKSASTPIDTDKPFLKDPDVCACECFQVTPKASHLHAVNRIFRYLKGKPYLGLWYPKDSPFDLVAYLDSDYAGASLDRKSTTEECQFLGCRLISWQCKKQTVVATSSTEAEYFWTTAAVKKVNVVIRLQDLVNKKKVVVMEATIRESFHLDDAEGVECLPNEEIFAALARMGYEKPSTELTFYKAFFLSYWKVGKGFSRVETPLFEGMLVAQEVGEGVADEEHNEGVLAAGDVAEGDVSAAHNKVPTADEEPSIPSPMPPTLPP